MATAWLRALHLVADDAPWVFEDRAAIDFLSPYQQRFLKRLSTMPRNWPRTFRQRRDALTTMRSQIVVRARYAEDALAAARKRGCHRYVILAAGLDTFALRQRQAGPIQAGPIQAGPIQAGPIQAGPIQAGPNNDGPISVVEIDHPATQAWKQQQLKSHGHETVENLSFVAVDFERDTLEERLPATGKPQYISWLGTTYYLSREAISATLTTLAETSAPGSELVLDYWQQPSAFDLNAGLFWGARVATAFQQEPMRSFFKPGKIEQLALAAGWAIRENCAPIIQDERYLSGRTDNLAVPSFAYLLHLER